jgi:oligopeptide transport system substrate-binding protein
MRFSPRLAVIGLALAGALTLGSCSDDEDRGPVIVSIAGRPDDLSDPLEHLPSPAAKLMM